MSVITNVGALSSVIEKALRSYDNQSGYFGIARNNQDVEASIPMNSIPVARNDLFIWGVHKWGDKKHKVF